MTIKRFFWASVGMLLLSVALAAALPGGRQATAAASASPNIAEQLQQEFAQVAEKVNPTVVNVFVAKPVEASGQQFYEFPNVPMPPELREFFGMPQQPGRQGQRGRVRPQEQPKVQGMGSGVIIDAKNGYILTNNHVVGGATEMEVTLIDGKRFKAEIVGTDPRTDLAVVQIKAEGLKEIEWGDSEALKVGYWVLAFGQPEGLRYTVTQGIVSAKGRVNLGIIREEGTNGYVSGYEDFIQSDAAVNPGNSGGPLTDIQGRLVGINTAIATRGAPQFAGISFAIPSNLAHKVAMQLVEHGEVTRGWIGVLIGNLSDQEDDVIKPFGENAKGVYVAGVEPGEPAEKAGMKTGDVIVSLDGKATEDVNELRYTIADAAVGAKVKVGVVRVEDGKANKLTLEVEVAKQPKSFVREKEGGVASTELGITIQTLTPEVAEALGYDRDEKGVAVTAVEEGSRAAKADIEVGDIISQVTYKGKQTKIATADDFMEATSKLPESESFVVLRKRHGQTKFVTIE